MTLAECKEQIEKHRAEARRLRRKADAEDAMADALRDVAAKLATGTIPFMQGMDDGKDS